MSNVLSKKIELFSTSFSSDTIPLSEGKIGQKYAICEIRADTEELLRFAALGMYVGAVIEPLFAAPWGSPVAYKVADVEIALARACARIILVRSVRS